MPARSLYFYNRDSDGLVASEFTGGGTREGGFPTYVKYGAVVSAFTCSAADVQEAGNAGTAILTAMAIVDGAVEHVETGVGISAFTVRGEGGKKNGTGISEFTASGAQFVRSSVRYVAAGAFTALTAGGTVPLPSGYAVGDLFLLYVETDDEPVSTPADWVLIGNHALGASTRLQTFARFAASLGETAPSLNDSGDHQHAVIIAWRGVNAVDPYTVGAGSAGSDASCEITSVTTAYPDAFVLLCLAQGRDAAGEHFSSPTNANLTGLQQHFDDSSTGGNGGGIGVFSGAKASAGATGQSVVTLVTSTAWATYHIALYPASVNIKTGAGVASLSASGEHVSELNRSGAAETMFSASGYGPYNRSGSAVSEYIASGVDVVEWAKSGTGVLPATAEGVTVDVFDQAGAAVSERSGTGANVVTYVRKGAGVLVRAASAAPQISVSRYGRATLIATGSGGQDSQEAGVARAVFTGSAARQVDLNKTGIAKMRASSSSEFYPYLTQGKAEWTLHRSGAGHRLLWGSGRSASTWVEAGAAIQERSGGGVSSFYSSSQAGWLYARAGTGASILAAEGADVVEHAESGSGVAPFTAAGTTNPKPGTAILPFSAAGTWRSLFANDNFAAREQIDVLTGDLDLDAGPRSWLLAGSSARWTGSGWVSATDETGERLGASFASFTKTLWWELVVPYRCIVALSVRDTAYPQVTNNAKGMANRGTAVNALTYYGDPRLHFGEDAGRGAEAASQGVSSSHQAGWGAIPHPTFAENLVQVDPLTPLAINVGRRSDSGMWELDYLLSVRRLDPPLGDNLSGAIPLEGASGIEPFDMLSATGDPNWDFAQLTSLLYRGNFNRMSGDVFYRVQPDADAVLRFRVHRQPAAPQSLSEVQALVFEGDDFGSWTPLPVGTYDDQYPYASLGPNLTLESGFAEARMTAGTPYVVALVQVRGVGYFEGVGVISTGTAPRRAGQLEWEVLSLDPSNDDFADREALSGASGSTSVADTRGSTFEVDEPTTGPYVETIHTVWYEYTPATSGWYDFYPAAWAQFHSYVVIYVDAFRGSSLATLKRASSQYFGALLWLRGGETYAVRVAPDEGGTYDHGSFLWSLFQASVASNDDFANRTAISGSTGSSTFQFQGATTEEDEPVAYYWDDFAQPSLWWGFTPPSTGTYVLRVPEPYWYFSVAVYSGSSLATLAPLSRFQGDSITEIGFDAQAGVEYKVQVSNYVSHIDLSAIYFTLEWEPHTRKTNSTFAAAEDVSDLAAGEVLPWDTLGMPGAMEAGAPDMSALFGNSPEWGWTQGRPAWFKFVAPYTARFTFAVNAEDWSGAFGVFKGTDLAGLAVTVDDPFGLYWQQTVSIDETGWGETLVDAYLLSGETYYLLLTGTSTFPLFYQPALGAHEQALYDDSQAPQGRFSLSWTAQVLNDNLADADNVSSNLNVVLTPTYPEDVAAGDLYYYEYSNLTGNCKVGSTVGATAEAGEPGILGEPATRTVWFYFNPSAEGDHEFWVEPHGGNPALNPSMAVYRLPWASPPLSLTFANLVLVGSDDNTDGLYPRLTVPVGADDLFAPLYVQVDSFDIGDFRLHVRHRPDEAAPANDAFANAQTLVPNTPAAGTTVGSMVECGEMGTVWGSYGGPNGSVWYKFVASETTAGIALLTSTNDWYSDILSVYQGTVLDSLTLLAEDSGDVGFAITLPFSMEAGQTYYVRVMSVTYGENPVIYSDAWQFPFTLELLAQSVVPPGNDNGADGTPATGGDTPGSTDGSTVEPGEPDPINGGTLPSGAGTTWHKYVAPASGFVDIYTTRATPAQQWYAVGVWEGASHVASKQVTALQHNPPTSGAAMACHYEVRAGQTYWIQVVRRQDQTWGDYTLHVVEYLETVDWSLDVDGFTSTTGSPSIAGGVMTCTGNQAISDVTQTSSQYGTVDLGASLKQWAREWRFHFEIRVVGGQVLYRKLQYGRENWSWDNSQSNSHSIISAWLGLFRIRDTSGKQVLSGSLRPDRGGENVLRIEGRGYAGGFGQRVDVPISLGAGRSHHDSGWVSVEVVTSMSFSGLTYAGNPGPYDPFWTTLVYVDGRPHTSAGFYGLQPRYVDMGITRHPTANSTDQLMLENSEAWTLQMRRMRITNKVPRDPYDVEFSGDIGAFEFDGFTPGVPWSTDGTRHVATVSPTGALPVTAFPGKPGWGAVHGSYPTGSRATVRYGLQWSSRRGYGLSLDVAEFPATTLSMAGYTTAYATSLPQLGSGMGVLRLQPDGELRIRPYGQRDFCVAHLSTDSHYWIEVHVDAEVMWDVRCTVYINGASYGTFSNVYSYAEVAADQPLTTVGTYPAAHADEQSLLFGSVGVQTSHDWYLGNMVAFRSSPGMVGPLGTVRVAAADAELQHNIPDAPAPGEYVDLLNTAGETAARIFNWEYESYSGGSWVATSPPSGVKGYADIGIGAPHYWRNWFELRPTTALSEGGAWSDVNQGRTQARDSLAVSAAASGGTGYLTLTQFGQSVPVDATVEGIEVRVHRRATGTVTDDSVRIVKAGSVTGSEMALGGNWGDEVVTYGGPTQLWGTTWTPQEVNALNFGVALSATGSGTAEVEHVTLKVYFHDEGSTYMHYRGVFRPSGPRDNAWMDAPIAVTYMTGTGGEGAVDFPYGVAYMSWGGGPAGPLTGTPKQRWGVVRPMWDWSVRGDYWGRINYQQAGGGTGTASTFLLVVGAYSYPRYAWTDDYGATWTWIEPGEAQSSSRINANVGASPGGKEVFLDNIGAMETIIYGTGSWTSGYAGNDEPSAAYAYRMAGYHLSYAVEQTTEPEVFAANLWARWRGYLEVPDPGDQGAAPTFRAYVANSAGDVRRVTSFTGAGTIASPAIQRFTQPRDAGGTAWTAADFNAVETRVGYDRALSSGQSFVTNASGIGAALQALTWELLVPADPDPPPPPCAQLIDLSMGRFALGSGVADATGDPPGVDLSDVRFTSGAGDQPGGAAGVDLSDVLFSSGESE